MPAPMVPDWFWKQRDDLLAEVTRMMGQPRASQRFAIAALPDATKYPGMVLPVKDGASNKPTVTSDGTIWRYMDGTAV